MLCIGHNISLLPSRALSLLFDDVTLGDHFHGVQLACVYFLNKVYCAEASFSDLVDYLEVRELQFRWLRAFVRWGGAAASLNASIVAFCRWDTDLFLVASLLLLNLYIRNVVLIDLNLHPFLVFALLMVRQSCPLFSMCVKSTALGFIKTANLIAPLIFNKAAFCGVSLLILLSFKYDACKYLGYHDLL